MKKIAFALALSILTASFTKEVGIDYFKTDFKVGNFTVEKVKQEKKFYVPPIINLPVEIKSNGAPLSEILKGICLSENLNCDFSSFEKASFPIKVRYKGSLGGFLKYLYNNYGFEFSYDDNILRLENPGNILANNENGENELPEDIKITLNLQNIPLNKVLKLISLQTGYVFIPSPEVDLSRKVSIAIVDKPLSSALKGLLFPLGYSYRVEPDRTIKIVKIQTRVFHIPYIYRKESFSFTAGGDANGQKRVSVDDDFWQDLEDNIKTLLSQDGKYAINKEKGLIVVSDRPDVLDRIGDYLNTLKQRTLEICRYRIGIYELTTTKDIDVGIDFKRVFYDEKGKTGTVHITGNSGIVESFLLSYEKTGKYGFAYLLKLLGQRGKVKTIYDQIVDSTCGETVSIIPAEAYKYLESVQTQAISAGANNGYITQTPVFQTVLLGPQVYITADKVSNSKYSFLINITDKYIKSFKSYTFQGNSYNFPERIGQNQVSLSSYVSKGQIQIIAGFKHYKFISQETGIPILMDIPLLGNLFKGQSKNKVLSEYVILIQPY
jgi:MSHA biogenesis protein MshL